MVIGLIFIFFQLQNVFALPTDRFEFAAAVLSAHNDIRRLHGVGPLILNNDISRISQGYSDLLAQSRLALVPSLNTYLGQQLGENLAISSNNPSFSGYAVTSLWYQGLKSYNFITPDFSADSGAFTQIVWRSTTEIGVGISQSLDGSFYVVVNYSPAGNIIGQFAANVFNKQPQFDFSSSPFLQRFIVNDFFVSGVQAGPIRQPFGFIPHREFDDVHRNDFDDHRDHGFDDHRDQGFDNNRDQGFDNNRESDRRVDNKILMDNTDNRFKTGDNRVSNEKDINRQPIREPVQTKEKPIVAHERPIQEKPEATRERVQEKPVQQRPEATNERVQEKPVQQRPEATHERVQEKPVQQRPEATHERVQERPVQQRPEATQERVQERTHGSGRVF